MIIVDYSFRSETACNESSDSVIQGNRISARPRDGLDFQWRMGM